jgi:mannitol-1-/sugar-/sorbitol-6-phosphatase
VTFAAVISDLDGVLVDSAAASTRAWTAWAARHGLDGAAIQAANHGLPTRDVVAELVPAEIVDAEAALLLEAEVADAGGVVAFPGAAAVMALPVVAIATSCTHPLAVVRVQAAGLPAPAVLVTADQVRHGKPAPDPYLLAAERLGVDPADCLVLEDAPSGIAAGRAAGMTVWAVTTTHPASELTAAQRVAAGLPELLAALSARDRPREGAADTSRSRSSRAAPRARAAPRRR